MAENVRVAVRVRPFNSREKTRNSTLIIKMLGNNTEIKDPSMPEAEPKKFAFDFSYWSHDSFEEDDKGYLHPTDPKYADQEIVFKDLGQGVLDNAWKGFNCSLFAYGQTGSGKSYSMVGYGANKGVIPIFCDTLFKEIDEKKASGTVAEYQVALSMLEIYNEQVRDLLNPASNKKGGLKVRQHPNKGFYVESLVTVPVKSYADIDNKIEEGTRSRTVAATNMNATSSRAHTIVAITFIQKAKNEAGQNMTKTSVINLVDLAGSERAESTGATGDRLKEGSAINQSLSMLGNCIKALADQSTGKKGVLVPFRDSVLTKLLKNALGGNSKTIMIAALSPADINYEETLSTLRFADRAKAIKTKAIINESPTDKLIRELREENARLMEEIKKGGVVYVQGEAVPAEQQGPGGPSEEEVEEMKREMEEQLKRNQDEMEQMKKSWQERLQETEATYKAKEEEEKKEKEMRKTTPHFWNLNEDPQLSNMIVHFIKPGTQKLGNRKADPPAQITLSGLSILPDHASITCKQNAIKIRPTQDAKLLVNGKPCTEETALHHNDRVMFGSSNLFVLHHPAELDQANKSGQLVEKVTFDMAQEEIAQNSGFNMDKTGGKSKDELLLQDDLVQLVPMVNESNAMAEELGKKVKFELMLISPQARGLKEGRTEVKVKMKSKDDDAEWVWDRNKFFNRKYLMQEMYQNFVEGEDWEKSQDNDPFWEPDDTDVMIGSAQVYLQSLAYKIELEENLAITDHRGADMGHLQVEIYPCDSKGNEDIDDFVEEPSELIGKELIFNLKIPAARGLPQRFSKGKTYCSYKLYLDKESSLTQIISNTINPDFGYIKRFAFSPVTKQFLDYLVNQPLIIEVWGKQVGRKVSKVQAPTKPSVQKPNAAPQLNVQTKRNVEIIHRSYSSNVAAQPQPSQQTANVESIPRSHSLTNDDRKHQLQLTKSIRRADRSDKKLKKIRELVEEAKKNKTTTLEVSVLEGILNGGEGDKFKATASVVMTTNKAAAENDGKITSSACVLQ